MGEDTAPLFAGLIDTVYISLNAPDSDTYIKLCSPKFGEHAYEAVLKFAREIVKYVPDVLVTAVESSLTQEEIQRCMIVADGLGIKFGLRSGI